MVEEKGLENEIKILPVCANCKGIRIEGEWIYKDDGVLYRFYMRLHDEKPKTHGTCKPCAIELYGDDFFK